MTKKSNYLIIQIDIGSGTQWGGKETISPIRDIFIPSVKKYCNKFQYDYLLIKESIYETRYGDFDFLATKNKHYSFERYFHLSNDYDYTIYIDNDVYVYSDAKQLPSFIGLANVREPEGNSSKIFREVNKLDISYHYYNSGVTFCNNFTAKKLSSYMIERLDKKNKAKGKNSDNMMLNEFIIKNKDIFMEVGSEWNYMPFLENSIKVDKPNFFHFVGIMGKEIINRLQDKDINIKTFLDQIKK